MRLTRALGIMGLLQGVGLLCALPRWIPTWRPAIEGHIALLGVGAFVVALVWLVGVFKRGPLGRRVAAALFIPVAAGWTLLAGALSVFLLQPYFYGSQVVDQRHCPDGRNVWVLDVSFLDPEYVVEVQDGALPFSHESGRGRGDRPDDPCR